MTSKQIGLDFRGKLIKTGCELHVNAFAFWFSQFHRKDELRCELHVRQTSEAECFVRLPPPPPEKNNTNPINSGFVLFICEDCFGIKAKR